VHPIKKSFTTASNGVFHRNTVYLSKGNLPKVIRIDPGQINVWCASIYDEEKTDLNLSRREYNKSRVRYGRSFVEGVKLVQYEKNFVINLNYSDVLTRLYSSRQY